MGIARAKIRLENPTRRDIKIVEADALVDTGSLFLCLPEAIQHQLQLEETSKKEVAEVKDSKKATPKKEGPSKEVKKSTAKPAAKKTAAKKK